MRQGPATLFDRIRREGRHVLAGMALLLLTAAPPASAVLAADALRLRAFLVSPFRAEAPADARGAQGEARLTVQPDGEARLDLVSWDLADDTSQVMLRLEAGDGEEKPIVALPLQRDLDEGRVIGARFRIDPDTRRRLARGEGRLLLPRKAVDQAVGGTLLPQATRMTPLPSGAPAAAPLSSSGD